MRPILEPFFRVENGFWTQGRLTDEAVAVRRKKDAAAANGRASALKRQGRHSTERVASINGTSTERQRNSNLTNNHNHIPLDKSNGAKPASDKAFWDSAKAYLEDEAKDPGALIGKWCRDHGKPATAEALTRAQLDRPVQKIPFIEGCFRQRKAMVDDRARITV